VRSIAAVGTTAATTADQIARGAAQTAAVRADARFAGGDYYDAADCQGPRVGLGIARMIAHTTYRSEIDPRSRVGRAAPSDMRTLLTQDRYAVESTPFGILAGAGPGYGPGREGTGALVLAQEPCGAAFRASVHITYPAFRRTPTIGEARVCPYSGERMSQ